MKANIILIALFILTFMFPSIRNVDTADAETDISHCANLEATVARPACEAAAHVKPAPPTFDDTLMGVQGTAANVRNGTSYRMELRQNNRLRNGVPASGSSYSSDASAMRMGTESNTNVRNGTSYRNELRQQNRLRNGVPASGRKMK